MGFISYLHVTGKNRPCVLNPVNSFAQPVRTFYGFHRCSIACLTFFHYRCCPRLLLYFVISGGGYCNFMHMKHVPRSLKRKMIRQMFEDHPDYKRTTGMFAEDPSRGGGRYDRRGGDYGVKAENPRNPRGNNGERMRDVPVARLNVDMRV